MNTMAKLITEIRGERSLTEFAETIGVTLSSLSRYESGERNPGTRAVGPLLIEATPEQAAQILEALGIEDVGSFATEVAKLKRETQISPEGAAGA